MKTAFAAKRRTSKHDEQREQIALFQWIDSLVASVPALRMAFHVPNGGARPNKVDPKTGKRYSVEAAKLKAMGTRRGVFDVFLDVPRGFSFGYRMSGFTGQVAHGLRLEMKVGDGDLSTEQKAWRKDWVEMGYAVNVCYSWVEAAHRIAEYLAPIDGTLPCIDVTAAQARILRRALPHAAQ
jgi:hypothetical protein